MRRLSDQLERLIVTFQIVTSDCLSFWAALFRTRAALAAENLFLRKQLALFEEREKKAKLQLQPTAMFFKTGSIVRLAQRLGNRETSHAHCLASDGFLPVLALEVETTRPTASLSGGEMFDTSHGSRKPDLG